MTDDDESTSLTAALGASRIRAGHRERVDFTRVLLNTDRELRVTAVDDGSDVILSGKVTIPRIALRSKPLNFGDVTLMVDDGDEIVIKRGSGGSAAPTSPDAVKITVAKKCPHCGGDL